MALNQLVNVAEATTTITSGEHHPVDPLNKEPKQRVCKGGAICVRRLVESSIQNHIRNKTAIVKHGLLLFKASQRCKGQL